MNAGALWPGLVEAERRVRVMQTKLHRWAIHQRHEHMESRMQWKLHVRFGPEFGGCFALCLVRGGLGVTCFHYIGGVGVR